MKKLLLLLCITSSLFASMSETIHSSLSTYYENRNYSNSLQKSSGAVYGVGADIHYKASKYKLTYEQGGAVTKKPPLSKDLKNKKIFLRYAYGFNNALELYLNYIYIIDDNIAITTKGKVYGAGLSYKFNKQLSTYFSQYYTDYKNFNMHQSDLKIEYKMKIANVGVKISSISKYLRVDEEQTNSFTKNTQKEYFTSGAKLHLHYQTYHMGLGAYFGKRVFAIMNDGFKIQHHAMEFNRTYAVGLGKTISDFVVRFQYIYQRATELPPLQENVKVQNLRFIANYKF